MNVTIFLGGAPLLAGRRISRQKNGTAYRAESEELNVAELRHSFAGNSGGQHSGRRPNNA